MEAQMEDEEMVLVSAPVFRRRRSRTKHLGCICCERDGVCVCMCARAHNPNKLQGGQRRIIGLLLVIYLFMCHLQIRVAAVEAVWKELIYVTSFFMFFCLVFIWLQVWAI